jgi:arylsulfatase A-like enzyme
VKSRASTFRPSSRILLLVSTVALGCGGEPPGADGVRAPTIVLVSIDTLRPERLGVYGNAPDVSPAIDALAARGVVFDQALAPTPWTLPSHMSLLTGLDPIAHGVTSERRSLSSEVVTLAERLQAHGYRTAAFTDAGFLHHRFGFDQGFEIYEDERPKRGKGGFASLLPGALRWMSARGEDDFFVFLHSFDVHASYASTDPDVLREFRKRPTPDGPLDALLGTTRHLYLMRRMGIQRYGRLSQLLNDYDAGVRVADRGVEEIVALLERTGRFDDALVVVTSDHGESFLDHGPFVGHGLGLTDDELGIPLILKLPAGEAAGTRHGALVDLLDLAPTVLEVAGLPADPELQGESLLALVRGRTRQRDHVLGHSVNTGSYFVVEGGYKYISPPGLDAMTIATTHLGPMTPSLLAVTRPGTAYPMGGIGQGRILHYDQERDPLGVRDLFPSGARLYDRSSDPGEHHDVADERPELARRLRARLEQLRASSLRAARARGGGGEPVAPDEDQREQLAQLGYLAEASGHRTLDDAALPAQDPLEAPNTPDTTALLEQDRRVHRLRLQLADGAVLSPQASEVLREAARAYETWAQHHPEHAARAHWRLLELRELARAAHLDVDPG